VRTTAIFALALAFAAGVAPGAAADGGGAATDVAPAFGKLWTTVPGGIVPLDPHTGRIAGRAVATGQLSALAGGAGGLWGLRPWTVVRIDPGPRTVRPTSIHGPAYALAAGFGSVWAANYEDGTLTRVDARTGRVVASIAGVGRAAEGVAVGFGAVWVSSIGPWRKGRGGVMVPAGAGTVTRIDPRRNAVVARIRVGRGAAAIATGEGSVWVLTSRGIRPDDTVSRIDPDTNRVTRSIRVPREATAVAAGAGSAWVVAWPGGGGVLARIDAATYRALVVALRRSWTPESVRVFSKHVWVADDGTATVHRLSAATLRGTAVPIPRSRSLAPPRIAPVADPKKADGIDWLPLAVGGMVAALALAGAVVAGVRRIRPA
jgi:DNA-binding beta-propeller fold protein YncE